MTQLAPTPDQLALQRRCELCADVTQHELLYRKWGYPILRCRQCCLISTATTSSDSVIDNPTDFYDGDYFEGGLRDGYVSYEREKHVLRKQFHRFLSRHVLPYKSEGEFLDVGCAYGYAVAAANDTFQAHGIDVSRHAIDFAQRQGLDCQINTLNRLDATRRFDVITMLDCIEHLPTPRADVAKAFELLNPNGLFVVTTGDISGYYPRLAGKYWRLMTPPQHLFYFSRATLSQMLKDVGFTILRSSCDWKHVPLSLAAYQVFSRLGLPAAWTRRLPGSLPMSLFDTITIVARKSE